MGRRQPWKGRSGCWAAGTRGSAPSRPARPLPASPRSQSGATGRSSARAARIPVGRQPRGALGYIGDLQPLYPLRPVGRIAGLGLLFLLLARLVLRSLLRHGVPPSGRVLRRVRGLYGLLFRVVYRDGVIEARDLEDAPVVVAQAVGHQRLLLAVDADEQRDQ